MDQSSVSKSAPIPCGVIGVGRMGRHHARIYSQLPGVNFLGVVDRSAERVEAITGEWGGRGFESVRAMIDAGVKAVTIATPTVHHRAAAEELLAAGVACLIEKPLAPRGLLGVSAMGPVVVGLFAPFALAWAIFMGMGVWCMLTLHGTVRWVTTGAQGLAGRPERIKSTREEIDRQVKASIRPWPGDPDRSAG